MKLTRKDKLEDFTHKQLMQFAKDLSAQTVYQQTEINELEKESRRLREGLEFIKKHMETVAGDAGKLSAVYNIACKTLKEADSE